MYDEILRSAVPDELLRETLALCRIPSPSGFTEKITRYLERELSSLGYQPRRMEKGGLTCDLGGEGDDLVVSAHIDTIGAQVNAVRDNGRLRLALIGGVVLANLDGENCEVHTRDGRVYGGTLQLDQPSSHANGEVRTTVRTADTVEVVLDAKVFSKADTLALGIQNGDYVCFDPRAVLTPEGYIKSRHLDDKAPVAILLALARQYARENRRPGRHTVLHFPDWEEVGHGGACGLPAGTREFLAVDVGVVGRDMEGSEYAVSVVAKDSFGPYHYGTTSRLIGAARAAGAPCAVDVYPERYGSDAGAALRAGLDVRTGLIGPGVSATHGYERAHKEGLTAALALLQEYVG